MFVRSYPLRMAQLLGHARDRPAPQQPERLEVDRTQVCPTTVFVVVGAKWFEPDASQELRDRFFGREQPLGTDVVQLRVWPDTTLGHISGKVRAAAPELLAATLPVAAPAAAPAEGDAAPLSAPAGVSEMNLIIGAAYVDRHGMAAVKQLGVASRVRGHRGNQLQLGALGFYSGDVLLVRAERYVPAGGAVLSEPLELAEDAEV